ncbi:ABC-type phosphate/phosphonate transport system substrate-binding protein [Sulfuritortus calidifontis]|uniref:ABC-type phosphate/phosphonate transport system substrate-binding protein n=1 Tax=Sulfuritortus calidifontis TaxID=1914471 RepID=A0A4R3JVB6_9PROT|nr:phosphate/phosphite/phosphonate ABC transporter substrate-binding protein [Sulfuritortus calidifontis]TCS71915.1 ABC-type phosphate/phosphonate transport system substrate-binding protein [Sulfuritortus calidifontis]
MPARWWLVSGWLLVLAAALPAAAQPPQAKTLSIGLFPNLSARTLVTLYQPLREFLQADLGYAVELRTAGDFHSYIERLAEREFDLAVVAPHFARYAQQEVGYQPIARYQAPVEACIIVANSSTARTLQDLKDSRIAEPDKLALVTMLGVDLLEQAGLVEGGDFGHYEARSHNNVALAVINRQAPAGMIGCLPLAQLPDETRQQLRILAKSSAMPSQYFISHPGMGREEQARLVQALSRFSVSSAGQAFLKQSGLKGIEAANGGELKATDPYVKKLRKHLRDVRK